MHSIMDLELVNYINLDFKWNPMKKGRRSMTRFPRKPGANSSKLGNKIKDPAVFEIKSGVDVIGQHFSEKVSDAPLKKRRLLRQSTSPPPQTPCQTSSFLHEECRSNSPLKPTKKEVFELDDFSGIELLAAAACSSLIHDGEDHVKEPSKVEEHTKETIVSIESDCSLVKDCVVPNTHNNGDDEGGDKRVRFHWDLNTVMDEWEEPHSNEKSSEGIKNDGLNSVKSNLGAEESTYDAAISVMPLVENYNGDSFGKTYESIEDLNSPRELIDTKTISSKTSGSESAASKSDMVDSLIHQEKHQDFSISEVLQEGFQSPKLCNSFGNKKVTPEDPQSDGCGSNVTQDEQGDTMQKVEDGYDSPFEDGELREQVYYESDNIYEDDFSTVESEKIEVSRDHGQTVEDRSNLLVKEVEEKLQMVGNGSLEGKEDAIERKNGCEVNVDASGCGSGKVFFERKNGHHESKTPGGNLLHIDGSTSFDMCRNGVYVQRSRSSNIGDSYSRSTRDLGPEKFTGREKFSYQCSGPTRAWDLKNSHDYHRPKNITRSLDNNQSRNYNSNGPYRTFNKKPSPSERNDAYGVHRAPHKGRSGFHDPEPCYIERKTRRFSPNFNRPVRRSRSRSRSGSPIAWHFQKRKNLDTKRQSPDQKPSFSGQIEAGFERTSGFDDRKVVFRRTEYPERLKSGDHFRRPGRFSRDDEKYETTRRFRYGVDRSFEDNRFKDAAGTVVPESTSKEKGPRSEY